MSTSPPTRRAPSRPAGAWRRILAPVVIFVAAIFAAGIAYGVAKGVGAGETSALVVAQIALGATILALGLGFRAALPAHERRAMTAGKVSLGKALALAVGVALAARIGIGIINATAEAIDPSLCKKFTEVALDQADTPALWHKIMIAFALVVLAPLGEELVFRGILLRGLVRVMAFPVAAIISGVLFGLAHQNYWIAWPLILGICLFGMVAAVIYRRFGYPMAVLTHAVFNGIAAIFLFVEIETAREDCPTA